MQESVMKMSCQNARTLVASYTDGELSEAQAGPLRAHLLDCPSCREAVKREVALKRWFEAARAETVEVPAGFAARVARRAFAGDPGFLTPAQPSPSGAGSLLSFVLALSAVAAAVLLAFSIVIQRRSLPRGEGLDAGEHAPWLVENEKLNEGVALPAASEGEDEARSE